MLRRCSALVLLILLVGLSLGSGVAEAHQLKSDNGYTAVMHIDPDDDPAAGEPTVINFLIGKDNGSYNQNNYDIAIAVSAPGRPAEHAVVEPAVFGNAADGRANYTFPAMNVYTIDLTGHRKADPNDKFHMSFIVRVAGTADSAAYKGNATDVLVLSAGGLSILGLVAYSGIVRGDRYSRKP